MNSNSLNKQFLISKKCHFWHFWHFKREFDAILRQFKSPLKAREAIFKEPSEDDYSRPRYKLSPASISLF